MKETANPTKMKEVGNRLKSVREALGLKQKDFAEPLHVTSSYISQLENGIRPKPGISIYFSIADHYRISMDYLFHGTGEMFLNSKAAVDPDNREYVDELETEEDLLWMMKRSKFFKDSVMGYAGKFKYEHDDVIKKSIEIYRKKHPPAPSI